MAYRCKVCGYKFKSGDDDLCPQCFTARDDINCTDQPGHSHTFDTSNERNSFIEHEKLREDIPSVSELSGQAHRAADELEKKYQTYKNDRHKAAGVHQNPYISQTANKAQDSFQSREAMKNNAARNNAGSSFNYNSYSDLVNQLSGNKNGNKAKGCLAAFIVLFFVFPILGVVLSSGSTIMKAVKDAKNEENGNKAHKIETPEIDPPDIDMPSIPDFSSMLDGLFNYNYDAPKFEIDSSQKDICGSGNKIIYSACYKPEEISDIDKENIEYLDHGLKKEQLYQYEVDFTDSNGEPLDVADIIMTVSGIDANGDCTYTFWGQTGNMYILLPEKVRYYSLSVTYFGEDGSQKDMIFMFDVQDLPKFS